MSRAARSHKGPGGLIHQTRSRTRANELAAELNPWSGLANLHKFGSGRSSPPSW